MNVVYVDGKMAFHTVSDFRAGLPLINFQSKTSALEINGKFLIPGSNTVFVSTLRPDFGRILLHLY